ncbi:unnamed protein product [Microthlaspi erraticum]|uniref:MATH domain-containing protein n=1 Tax=Microthlaspi erraticum TaxID=1685480 RepID=A0A6D2JB17_9BRAS|nr:unnamed protein product [Microthlaspi erraticum]
MGNQMQKGIADTGEKLQTSYTFEIINFSEKKALIVSPKFLSGGCGWNIVICPDGEDSDDYLHLYLRVHNPQSLRTGWKRKAYFRFSLLNKSGKVLYSRTEISTILFCSEFLSWGHKTLPLTLSKLKEEGFLEKNKLIVKVEVKVVEIVHESKVTGKEMLDFQGFNVLYSQVLPVLHIFNKHPDIDEDFKPKDKGVKTAYMNLLLSLIETLRKAPQSFSEAELSNAQSELNELTEAGFKLDWLKKKLDEVCLERKNAIADGSLGVEQVEQRIKNLEQTLSDLKVELESEKAKSAAATKVLSFEDIL